MSSASLLQQYKQITITNRLLQPKPVQLNTITTVNLATRHNRAHISASLTFVSTCTESVFCSYSYFYSALFCIY